MTLELNSNVRQSRVLSSPAHQWAVGGTYTAVLGLVRESQAHRHDDSDPIVALANHADAWRYTGMEAVCNLAGIKRMEFVTKRGRASAKLMEWLATPEGAKGVVQAVAKQLRDREVGRDGVPPQDRTTDGTRVLRDMVNERKKSYRTGFDLPALHWGNCSCCTTAQQYRLLRKCTSLKGLTETGEFREVLLEAFSSDDKLENRTMLAGLVAEASVDQVEGSLFHLLDGHGTQTLMRYRLTPRRRQDKPGTDWSLRSYCIECLHAFENPEQAIREAYGVKLLADLRWQLGRAVRTFSSVQKGWKAKLAELQKIREQADLHLKESSRVSDLASQGRSVQERSANFTPADEDALARDLWSAGLKAEVIRGKGQKLWRVQGPRGKGADGKSRTTMDNVERLQALMTDQSLLVENALSGDDLADVLRDAMAMSGGEEE